MANILITGGGRGVGLEFTRQLVELPTSRVSKIFVTTRSAPSAELQDLIQNSAGRVISIHCGADGAGAKTAAAAVDATLADDEGLDILINNIGVMPMTKGGIKAMGPDHLTEVFDTNVGSAQRMTAALLPAVLRSREKKVIMLSTTVGSITYAARFAHTPAPAYKVTKAALGMLAVQYAIEYADQGITCLTVSPGWLKTDLGSQWADLDVSTGVTAAKDLILDAGRDKNGKFYNIRVPGWEHAEGANQYDGAEVPW